MIRNPCPRSQCQTCQSYRVAQRKYMARRRGNLRARSRSMLFGVLMSRRENPHFEEYCGDNYGWPLSLAYNMGKKVHPDGCDGL